MTSKPVRLAQFTLAVALVTGVVLIGVFFLPSRPLFGPERNQYGPDVTWVPTPEVMVEKILDLAHVTSQDYVIDLGSGDGRIVIAAAKRGAQGLGIEFNPELVKWSEQSAAEAGVSEKAGFVKADFFESDFSQATVITMFLGDGINLELRPKLLDLRPGTRVVAIWFDMGDWLPDETVEITEDCDQFCTAYLWIVPAKVTGIWETAEGELTLSQEFQMVTGTLTSETGQASIADARLRGNEISFRVGEDQYVGEVNGESIEGVMNRDKQEFAWKVRKKT